MIDERGGGVGGGTDAGGLPVLSAGRHRRPDQGSCVKEYVSVLAGGPWSDRPRCTDRALGELARRVDDDVHADSRSALADAVRIRALGLATEDVRRHVSAPPRRGAVAAVPTTSARPW